MPGAVVGASCRILWRQPGKQSVSHALRDEQSCHDHPREDIARQMLVAYAGASPAQTPVAQLGFVVAAFRDRLLLAWGGMLINGAKSRVREAKLQDASRAAIACCMIVAAVASLFGAGILLAEAKALTGKEVIGHVALAAATVTASWSLVHTLLAVHYTHLFFAMRAGAATSQFAQGLDFPEEQDPDFLDFAYFSFVIGMTFQVSDVQITSRPIRRVVLVHSLLSFAFNTVILAFSINLAATLL